MGSSRLRRVHVGGRVLLVGDRYPARLTCDLISDCRRPSDIRPWVATKVEELVWIRDAEHYRRKAYAITRSRARCREACLREGYGVAQRVPPREGVFTSPQEASGRTSGATCRRLWASFWIVGTVLGGSCRTGKGRGPDLSVGSAGYSRCESGQGGPGVPLGVLPRTVSSAPGQDVLGRRRSLVTLR